MKTEMYTIVSDSYIFVVRATGHVQHSPCGTILQGLSKNGANKIAKAQKIGHVYVLISDRKVLVLN